MTLAVNLVPPTYAPFLIQDKNGNSTINPKWLKWFSDIGKFLSPLIPSGGGIPVPPPNTNFTGSPEYLDYSDNVAEQYDYTVINNNNITNTVNNYQWSIEDGDGDSASNALYAMGSGNSTVNNVTITYSIPPGDELFCDPSAEAVSVVGNSGNVTADGANSTQYLTFTRNQYGVQQLLTNSAITVNPSTATIGATTFSGNATTATTATNATNITTTDDTATNATYYPVFQTNAGTTAPLKTSSTKWTYNPSTGLLSIAAITVSGTTTFGDAATWGTAGISDTASYSTSGVTAPINFSYTNSYSSTAGGVSGMTLAPSLSSTGASAGNAQFFSVAPQYVSSSNNINTLRGFNVSPTVASSYTGTITNFNLFEVAVTNNGTNPITTLSRFQMDSINNGNGITSGTVTNIGLNVKGDLPSAGVGGTVINYGVSVNLSTGSSAGTTNVGLLITGNGGASSTNYAIQSTSAANSPFSGPINNVTITAPASTATLTLASGKTLTVNNSLTLAGTDSTTMTFPNTSATIARTDAANTFTGKQTFSNAIVSTVPGDVGASVPTLSSGSTIAPTTPIAFVSGTTTISTITAPAGTSNGGQVTLIPTGLWATNTSGNIALASTAVVSKALIMTYSASTSKWYPSY